MKRRSIAIGKIAVLIIVFVILLLSTIVFSYLVEIGLGRMRWPHFYLPPWGFIWGMTAFAATCWPIWTTGLGVWRRVVSFFFGLLSGIAALVVGDVILDVSVRFIVNKPMTDFQYESLSVLRTIILVLPILVAYVAARYYVKAWPPPKERGPQY